MMPIGNVVLTTNIILHDVNHKYTVSQTPQTVAIWGNILYTSSYIKILIKVVVDLDYF